MSRVLRLLLLALALVLAQATLAAHGIEHAYTGEDSACSECLALPGFAALPAQPPRLLATAPPTPVPALALPSRRCARPLPFHSRAPPRHQNDRPQS
jgi:hypothetical protein